MKTTLTYSSLNTEAPWPALLTKQLNHWHSLATISSAEVVLEHQGDDARAFRVKVRLEVTGPGLRAEASDSTLEGALTGATLDLEQQIESRKAQPVVQGNGTQKPSAIPKRGPGSIRRRGQP
jgi:ribosome-associated translation inhibitor RaiA